MGDRARGLGGRRSAVLWSRAPIPLTSASHHLISNPPYQREDDSAAANDHHKRGGLAAVDAAERRSSSPRSADHAAYVPDLDRRHGRALAVAQHEPVLADVVEPHAEPEPWWVLDERGTPESDGQRGPVRRKVEPGTPGQQRCESIGSGWERVLAARARGDRDATRPSSGRACTRGSLSRGVAPELQMGHVVRRALQLSVLRCPLWRWRAGGP